MTGENIGYTEWEHNTFDHSLLFISQKQNGYDKILMYEILLDGQFMTNTPEFQDVIVVKHENAEKHLAASSSGNIGFAVSPDYKTMITFDSETLTQFKLT